MFTRTKEILGQHILNQLQQTRVILFGVGGVGGWCAETLVRTGVQHLTIVDFDQIALSNLNRQLVATYDAIGLPKVEEMRQRLLSINPSADIQAICQRYDEDTSSQFTFDNYDYVIDAIDTLDNKALLIYQATSSSATLFSSMGAGRKLDATRIRTTEFWKVLGCPLARALRNKMRKSGLMPQKKFQCVYSDEISSESGTIAPIVGVFGMYLSHLLIQDIIRKANEQE